MDYVFTQDYTAETCLITSPTGVCTSIKQHSFKKGDVVDVTEEKQLFGQTQARVFVGIYDYYIPMSKLTKYVKPTTPTGTTTNSNTSTNTPGTSSEENNQETGFKKYLTKTNVIIGLIVLGITLTLLKIFKII